MLDLFKVVQCQAKTILEQVKAYEIIISFYISQNQMQMAINIGLELLNSLGVHLSQLPPNVQNLDLLYHLETLTNPTQLSALQILFKIVSAAYVVNPSLMFQMVFTMVDICLLYGNSTFAPTAYMLYGLFYCSTNNIELGYEYAKLALKLLERSDTKKVSGEVKLIFNSLICHWKEPLKNVVNSLDELIITCLEVGDIEHATYTSLIGCFVTMFGKKPLEHVIKQQIVYLKISKKYNNYSYVSSQIWVQLAENFTQESKVKGKLVGTFFDERKLIFDHNTKESNIVATLYVAKTIISYTFKDFAPSLVYVEKTPENGHLGGFPYAIRYFYYSLILLKICSVSNQETCLKYLQQVEINQAKMKIWAQHAPMNFQHTFDLVEAEKSRFLGNVIEAMQLYEQAIENAHNQEFLFHEAMAYELAADFYLSQGIKRVGLNYLLEAYYCYHNWGAIAKVKALEKEYPHLSLYSSNTNNSLSKTTKTTENKEQQILDLLSVMKATQAISSEIVLNNLLLSLMNILLENAGAQKGALILLQDNQWFVEIIKNSDSSQNVVLSSLLLSLCDCLSQKVVNYVIRTQESLILNNAREEGNFTDDPYIQNNQSQSILCAPLINQGKFQGIIYLENNLSTNVFTDKRLEMIKLLCTQAAISIENARLYVELEKRVNERTLELAQANQELKKLASLDGLTQIANRGCFNNYLPQQWQQHLIEGQPLGLILLDVDYFKRYNDFYGHQGGDACLIKIAQVISQTVKGVRDLVARYGGEEFVVILPYSDRENSLRIAELIRQAVKSLKIPHAQSEVSQYVSISLGIASFIPTTALSPDDLIADADKALYAAKKNGRDQVCLL